jgi:hypothetical protein
VPRAIGFAATPVHGLAGNVDALLVHEPWGWPVHVEGMARKTVILDRVDSADFFLRQIDHPDVTEVVSLSKTLGLLGGGLARRDGDFLEFRAQPLSQAMPELLERAGPQHAELFKNSDQAVHPAVTQWTREHCLRDAVEEERLRRQANVRVLVQSALAKDWPAWMHRAIDAGAGPGLAPILRHHSGDQRTSAMRRLAEDFGVASTISVFNWSGDPLEPGYGACLLVPLHGEMQCLEEVVEALLKSPC